MKKLWDKSVLFRYFISYVITLVICFTFLFLCELIPYKWVSKNVVESLNYHQTEFFNRKLMKNEIYDIGELSLLEMNFTADSRHPLKSLVENNTIKSGAARLDNHDTIEVEEYARYWWGQQGYERILLIFTDIKGIRIINAVILSILCIILIIKLFKESKEVMLSFILGIIVLSYFLMYKSVSFTFVPLIAMIGSIIIIDMYKKNSKHIGLFFFIIALYTGFFDAITIESLTLSLPLFIYCYLCIRDDKKLGLLTAVKYFGIWLLGFMIMLASKWLLTVIYYGPEYISYLKAKGSVRVANKQHENYNNIFELLGGMSLLLFPFNYFKYGYIVSIVIGIFFLLNFIFFLDKKKYLPLIFASCVPIIRFTLVFSHAEQLYTFTFRALLPFVMFILWVCIKQIFNVFRKDK